MNNRNMKSPTPASKSQTLSIVFKGKIFAICSQGQLEYMRVVAKEKICYEASVKKEKLTEAEIEARVKKNVEDQGFTTMELVMAQLTPEEIKQWQDSYRFAPISVGRK